MALRQGLKPCGRAAHVAIGCRFQAQAQFGGLRASLLELLGHSRWPRASLNAVRKRPLKARQAAVRLAPRRGQVVDLLELKGRLCKRIEALKLDVTEGFAGVLCAF